MKVNSAKYNSKWTYLGPFSSTMTWLFKLLELMWIWKMGLLGYVLALLPQPPALLPFHWPVSCMVQCSLYIPKMDNNF